MGNGGIQKHQKMVYTLVCKVMNKVAKNPQIAFKNCKSRPQPMK